MSNPRFGSLSIFGLARAALLVVALGSLGIATVAADGPSASTATPTSTAQKASRDGTPSDATAPHGAGATVEITVGDDDPGTSTKKRGHAHVQIGDDDFDSFKNAMDGAPWLVGVIFLVLGSIFLTPILLAIGIIWYKLRKTRMQNEAMLRLAERGVVPTAQALDAVGTGTAPIDVVPGGRTLNNTNAAAAGAATTPAYQQVVAGRRRVVWSDLRKGVLMIAAGLAFCFYWLTARGEPSWLGLVLLFLGVGYVAIWWLEDRHLQSRQAADSTSNRT